MKRAELVESVILILCVPTLWPFVQSLRAGEPLPSYYGLVILADVVVLVVILVRRIRRLRAAFRDRSGRPPFSF